MTSIKTTREKKRRTTTSKEATIKKGRKHQSRLTIKKPRNLLHRLRSKYLTRIRPARNLNKQKRIKISKDGELMSSYSDEFSSLCC